MNLKDVYSIKEAAKLWGISESNLRNALNRYGRFENQIKKGLAKKSGGAWIVTKKAMTEVFGEPKNFQITLKGDD